jgi:hypothetical protein
MTRPGSTRLSPGTLWKTSVNTLPTYVGVNRLAETIYPRGQTCPLTFVGPRGGLVIRARGTLPRGGLHPPEWSPGQGPVLAGSIPARGTGGGDYNNLGKFSTGGGVGVVWITIPHASTVTAGRLKVVAAPFLYQAEGEGQP